MNVQEVINKLEKARDEYVEKYGSHEKDYAPVFVEECDDDLGGPCIMPVVGVYLDSGVIVISIEED